MRSHFFGAHKVSRSVVRAGFVLAAHLFRSTANRCGSFSSPCAALHLRRNGGAHPCNRCRFDSDDAKVGNMDYTVRTDASPRALTQLNDIPIRQVNGATVYMRDAAQVH